MSLLATPRGRKILFSMLYLSEGAPIGYIWWALPTKLSEAGVPVDRTTALTAILVLPWTFKFLWAPLVDTLRSARWTLRSWIISAQAVMGGALLPLLALDLESGFALAYPLLVLHALAAATQDVAVDALCIARVPQEERGSLNGWMQASMLLGRAVFGGLALAVERSVGEGTVILALVLVVWGSLALVLASPDREAAGESGRRWRDFARSIRKAARGSGLWLGLFFAGLGGAAFEGVGAVRGHFLADSGVAKETVGWLFALPVPIAMALGALAGGALSDRIGRRAAAALFLVLTSGFVLAVAGIAARPDGVSETALLAAFVILYASTGLFTAASYALFMDLTDKSLGATQFSAFMGMTNACEAWAGLLAGGLAATWGYPLTFAVLSVLPMAALPALRAMRIPGHEGPRTE